MIRMRVDLSRQASLILFVLLCASATYWTLRLYRPDVRPVVAPPSMAAPAIDPSAAAMLFGGSPGAAPGSRITLTGIVHAGTMSGALIAVDGGPTRFISLGDAIDAQTVLAEVHKDHVIIRGQGAPARVGLPRVTTAAGIVEQATASIAAAVSDRESAATQSLNAHQRSAGSAAQSEAPRESTALGPRYGNPHSVSQAGDAVAQSAVVPARSGSMAPPANFECVTDVKGCETMHPEEQRRRAAKSRLRGA